MAGGKSKSNRTRKHGGEQRRSKGSKDSPQQQQQTTKSAPSSNSEANDQQSHKQQSGVSYWLAEAKPFVGITLLVAIPIALQTLYLYVCLQRPEWLVKVAAVLPATMSSKLSGFLRPSVATEDPRQVLIVGTQSSGTTQIAHELSTLFQLEIGHENSESSWSFVRDGTVSWFHGIRFVPRPGIDGETRTKSGNFALPTTTTTNDTKTMTLQGEHLFRYAVHTLCKELHPNMGFHPYMFRDNGQCSIRESWNQCWKKECTNLLEQEWGCALREDRKELTHSSSSTTTLSSSCTTPYHKTLLQVRHPLRTIESLVTKFCIGGLDGKVQPSFLVFATAWFPTHHDFSRFSCIEVAGYYVYEYNLAMMKAKQKDGTIDAVYQIETASPCEVVELAGFMDDETAAAPPKNDKNHQATILDGHRQRSASRLSSICRNDDTITKLHSPMASTENKFNQGQLSMKWDDLLGGKHGSEKKNGDKDLLQRLQKLATKLGYPVD